MARPRIFVSSTYYDLKHVRAQLELFIDSLGYDGVLSEKGQIAFTPDLPLDESCYREVRNCDIYVLIVGGRYGSEASSSEAGKLQTRPKDFFERYESITKLEYKAAVDTDIPIYILIDRSVYAEFQTFQRNRDNPHISYAHVDSVNVFRFIDEIFSRPRNNPLQTFERFTDIQAWLREQWAGLFREMLHRQTSQQQLTSLAAQVRELSEINTTLKRYLEEVVSKLVPNDAENLIQEESRRLDLSQKTERIRENRAIKYLSRATMLEFFEIARMLRQSTSADQFLEKLNAECERRNKSPLFPLPILLDSAEFLSDLNDARALLGLPVFSRNNKENLDSHLSAKKPRARKNARSQRSRAKSKLDEQTENSQ